MINPAVPFGKLTKLEPFFSDVTPNGKVRLGVYADKSGKPGALLLDAGEVTVTNSWVSISGLNLSGNAEHLLLAGVQHTKSQRCQIYDRVSKRVTLLDSGELWSASCQV